MSMAQRPLNIQVPKQKQIVISLKVLLLVDLAHTELTKVRVVHPRAQGGALFLGHRVVNEHKSLLQVPDCVPAYSEPRPDIVVHEC